MTELPLDASEDEIAGAVLDGLKREPGTITPQQQHVLLTYAAGTGMGRHEWLAAISDIVGRQVTSSNELSYTEAATVLEKLSGVQA